MNERGTPATRSAKTVLMGCPCYQNGAAASLPWVRGAGGRRGRRGHQTDEAPAAYPQQTARANELPGVAEDPAAEAHSLLRNEPPGLAAARSEPSGHENVHQRPGPGHRELGRPLGLGVTAEHRYEALLGRNGRLPAVKHGNDLAGEAHLRVPRVAAHHLCSLVGAQRRGQREECTHRFVGHAHDFAVHVLGLRQDGDVVPQALAHLGLPVGAGQDP